MSARIIREDTHENPGAPVALFRDRCSALFSYDEFLAWRVESEALAQNGLMAALCKRLSSVCKPTSQLQKN